MSGVLKKSAFAAKQTAPGKKEAAAEKIPKVLKKPAAAKAAEAAKKTAEAAKAAGPAATSVSKKPAAQAPSEHNATQVHSDYQAGPPAGHSASDGRMRTMTTQTAWHAGRLQGRFETIECMVQNQHQNKYRRWAQFSDTYAM